MKTAFNFHRLNVGQIKNFIALSAVSFLLSGCLKEAATVLFDPGQIPSGTIESSNVHVVKGKNYTQHNQVDLILNSSNSTEMAFFVDQDCSYQAAAQWEPYAPTKSITLLGADGLHRVSVIFRNEKRYSSGCQDLSVTLDREKPSTPDSVTIRARTTVLTASALFGFASSADSLTSVIGYEARVLASDGTPETDWRDLEFDGTNASITHYIADLALTDGSLYAIEVRAIDAAGNAGAGRKSSTFEAGPTVFIEKKIFLLSFGIVRARSQS